MRELADAERIRRFMQRLGQAARTEGTCYLTGGATAVLHGWRPTTVDVDIELVPEDDRLLRAIPRIKDELRINVELASPAHFIPLPAGWEERSLFAAREGTLTFRHYDPVSQVLAKLERAHHQDLLDVEAMIAARLVEPGQALAAFAEIEPQLYRFPAVDPAGFRSRVESLLEPRSRPARGV